MVGYLLRLTGLRITLARQVVDAMSAPHPYTAPVMPVVPDFVERRGDLFAPWRRRAYAGGYEAAQGVIRSIDELRPLSGDSYSKRCLMHIGIATGLTGHCRDFDWRLRERAEQITLAEIIGVNLRHQREQPRQWARSG
jgi:hypothetical protein